MDLDAFKRTLRYQRAAAPAQIITDLDDLSRFDRVHEMRERSARRLFKVLVVLLVLSIFFGIAIASDLPESTAGLVPILPVSLAIVAASALVRWRHWAKFNLPDERYQTLTALCRLVRADMPSDGTIEVSLDFNRAEQPGLLQGQQSRGRWKCKLYVQPWLRTRGRFVDGTRFDIRAVERCEVRTCSARSRSGKIKHKRKMKRGTVLDVSLIPKAGRTGDLSGQAARLGETVKLPTEARLMRTDAAADSVGLRAYVGRSAQGESPLAHTLALMLLGTYQIIVSALQEGGAK